jgi:hypothetical protein
LKMMTGGCGQFYPGPSRYAGDPFLNGYPGEIISDPIIKNPMPYTPQPIIDYARPPVYMPEPVIAPRRPPVYIPKPVVTPRPGPPPYNPPMGLPSRPVRGTPAPRFPSMKPPVITTRRGGGKAERQILKMLNAM